MAKKYRAIQIDKLRAELVALHLKARHRQGRNYVSYLARADKDGKGGYGTPTQSGGNIVTRQDIFEFVSQQLKGTPAQGSAGAVEASYKAVTRDRKRKRTNRSRGGE